MKIKVIRINESQLEHGLVHEFLNNIGYRVLAKDPAGIQFPAFLEQPQPIAEKAYFSPKTRLFTVEWADGSKTSHSVDENDVMDEYIGFAMCYTKKMFGSNSKFHNTVRRVYKDGAKKAKPQDSDCIAE